MYLLELDEYVFAVGDTDHKVETGVSPIDTVALAKVEDVSHLSRPSSHHARYIADNPALLSPREKSIRAIELLESHAPGARYEEEKLGRHDVWA